MRPSSSNLHKAATPSHSVLDPALTPEMVADLEEVSDALREVLNRKSMRYVTNEGVMHAVSQAFVTAHRASVVRSITLRGLQRKAMADQD